MWNNCAKKGAVSPATNRDTSPKIAQINPLITNQPIKRSRRTLKPVKLILMINKSDEEDYGSPKNNAWVRKGQTLTEEEKIAIINRAIAVQTGMEVGSEADF